MSIGMCENQNCRNRRIGSGLWLIVILFSAGLSTSQQALAGWPEANAAVERGDDVTAFHEWMELAQQGDAQAENNVGYAYERGKGIAVDYAQAREWYTKAAEQGLAEAQKNLGLMYMMEHGVTDDRSQKTFWLNKAAAQGHPQAEFLLGSILLETDPSKAVTWFRQAAEQGYAHADYQLGELYRAGNRVPQDTVQAYKWFSIAAQVYPSGTLRDEAEAAIREARRKLTVEQLAAADALVAAWRPTKVPLPVSPGIPLATGPQ